MERTSSVTIARIGTAGFRTLLEASLVVCIVRLCWRLILNSCGVNDGCVDGHMKRLDHIARQKRWRGTAAMRRRRGGGVAVARRRDGTVSELG